MDQAITNLLMDPGYEKLMQLSYEMYLFQTRMAENTALLCLGIQRLAAFFS